MRSICSTGSSRSWLSNPYAATAGSGVHWGTTVGDLMASLEPLHLGEIVALVAETETSLSQPEAKTRTTAA
jgi:hypothetical protein